MNIQQLKTLLEGKTLEIEFISDPGHGWIKISKKIRLGLKFTPYSYQDKNYLYLEEDLDASKYLDKLKANGIKYTFKETILNHESSIRNMDPLSWTVCLNVQIVDLLILLLIH